MKLRILSDLHCEHWVEIPSWVSTQLDYDYMIIAGDLCVSKQSPMLKTLFELTRKPIIFIPGNHDFWNSSYSYQDLKMRKDINPFGLNPSHFMYLNNDCVIIDKYIFIGCTLWWSEIPDERNKQLMNDFNKIHELVFNKSDGSDWGQFSISYIEEKLQYAKDNDLIAIVITHNAPSQKSIVSEYKGDPINCFFANDYDHIIEKYQPKLWIHGHMHNNVKYKIGNTTVICNPYGYRFKVNKDFKHDLIMGV